MEISVSLPLDNDGFLRRECPNCLQEFKWHDGPANEEAEAQQDTETYHCPLCGRPSGVDSWWTQAQLDYAQGVAMPAALQEIEHELDRAFRGLNSKHLKVTRTGHLDTPAEPMPLIEPDDMVMIASPCHPYEPVKVPEVEAGPFYCLVCGSAFAI